MCSWLTWSTGSCDASLRAVWCRAQVPALVPLSGFFLLLSVLCLVWCFILFTCCVASLEYDVSGRLFASSVYSVYSISTAGVPTFIAGSNVNGNPSPAPSGCSNVGYCDGQGYSWFSPFFLLAVSWLWIRTKARFNYAYFTAIDSVGTIYTAQVGNHVVRRISPGGLVTTIAGSGTVGLAAFCLPVLSTC